MSRQRLLLFAGLGVGVVVVYALSKVVWVTLLSAAVAAVVAIAIHRRLGSAEAAPAVPLEAAPELEWLGHLRSALELNVAIRENGLPEAVVAKLEQIIDELREMLPGLNEDHAGSELTWTVNRMAGDYLPRVVRPYVALGAGARADHEAELLDSLGGLENELSTIAGLVRNNKAGEFQAKSAFLRARFLDSVG